MACVDCFAPAVLDDGEVRRGIPAARGTLALSEARHVHAFQHSAQLLEDSLGEDAGARQGGVGRAVLLLAQVLLAVAILLGLHLLKPSLDHQRYNSLLV